MKNQLFKELNSEGKEVRKVSITQEHADRQNKHFESLKKNKDVGALKTAKRYELAGQEAETLVNWTKGEDGVLIPELAEGVTIAKMKKDELEANFPNIAETNPANVKEFKKAVIELYPNLK